MLFLVILVLLIYCFVITFLNIKLIDQIKHLKNEIEVFNSLNKTKKVLGKKVVIKSVGKESVNIICDKFTFERDAHMLNSLKYFVDGKGPYLFESSSKIFVSVNPIVFTKIIDGTEEDSESEFKNEEKEVAEVSVSFDGDEIWFNETNKKKQKLSEIEEQILNLRNYTLENKNGNIHFFET